MPEQSALKLADLPIGTKKTVILDDTKILLVRTEDTPNGQPSLFALEAECPHAKAPLEKGAVCNGRLVCPWHTGTFALDTGKLLEPPPLRDLKRYPVRLAGEDILVDPIPVVPAKPAVIGADKHFVFAGAGAATAAALAYLRDAGFGGTCTLIDPQMDEPIDRTQLSKMALAGKKPLDTLPIFSLPGQGEPVEGREPLAPLTMQRFKAHVTSLDPEASTVTLGENHAISYDALLLATGGSPKRPDLPGVNLPQVFTIRHSEDLRRMEPLLGEGKHVVLLGDSFIAFEAASALTQRGLKVTVVAQSDLPFAKKFGPVIAQALTTLHKTKGVTILPNTEAAAITEKEVELKDTGRPSQGDRIPADVVILAIGVTPDLGYLPEAAKLPLGEKGGLALSPNLQVMPKVWAAGDIASVDGTRIEHWRLAEQHGRTAAEAMLASVTGNGLGPAQPFSGVPFFWTFHFGKRLGYAGHADKWDAIQYDGDPMQLDFLAYYLKEDKVAAVLGCGRDTALAALMEPLREALTLEQARSITAAA